MLYYRNEEDHTILAYFQSETLIQTIYNEAFQSLYVVFEKGNIYTYRPVSRELYDRLEKAESHGKFLNEHIVRNPDIKADKRMTLSAQEVQNLRECAQELYREAQLLNEDSST